MTSTGAEKMTQGYHRRRYFERPCSTPIGCLTAQAAASPMTRPATPRLIAWVGPDAVRLRLRADRPLSSRLRAGAGGRPALPLVKVNPRQARRFAEATGKLAKTDRLDAAHARPHGCAPRARSAACLQPCASPISRTSTSPARRWSRIAPRQRTAPKALTLAAPQASQRGSVSNHIERQIAAIEAEIMAASKPIPTSRTASTSCLASPASRRIAAFALLDRHARARHARSRPGRKPRRPRARSRANPDAGPAAPSFAAAAPMSARRSTCRPSSPPASTPTSRPNTLTSSQPANRPKVALAAIMRKMLLLANALLRDKPTLDPITCLINTDTLAALGRRKTGCEPPAHSVLAVIPSILRSGRR